MKTQTDSIQEDKSQSSSHGKFQSQGGGESTFQFVDNRSEAIVQRKLQELANNSPHAKKIAQFQAMADNQSAQQQPIQKKENNTGLPDNLKTGVENLSGISLDDVKVHRNSDKPAQLQAHAYAQGTDIHLGAGQEKHLPHEAWHVVQQKQGRVKPTMQMKGGVLVNDEMGLEKEADVMGQKAQSVGMISETGNDISTAQRMEKEVIQGKFTLVSSPQFSKTQPIQLEGEETPAEAPQQNAKGKAAAVWTDLKEQVGLMREGKTTTSKVGATLARRIGSEASDELYNTIKKLKELPNAEESENKKKIGELEKLMQINTGVGEKFDKLIGGPKTFMSQEEMDLHLDLFKTGGAHAFITDDYHKNFNGAWNGWGKDRNFVSILTRANELVAEAQNDQGIITLEKKLGITEWNWVNQCPEGIIWRYIIEPDKIEKAGLSMAHGKESGAYGGEWIAGGETKGGEKEATIGVFKGEEFKKALKDVIKVEPLDLSKQTPKKPETKQANFQDLIPERYKETGGGFGGQSQKGEKFKQDLKGVPKNS